MGIGGGFLDIIITVEDNSRVQDAIALLPTRAPQASDKALAVMGPRLLEQLRQATPVDTGELRDAWVLSDLDQGILLLNAAPHVMWVLEGTGVFGPTGQTIKPTTKKYMRFIGRSGEVVFAREVRGQQGRDFVAAAFDEEEVAEELGDLIIQGLLGDIEG